VRGPQAGVRAGRGNHDLRVRVLELPPAQDRIIEAAADDPQPCPLRCGVPGRAGLPAARRKAAVPGPALGRPPGRPGARARAPRSPARYQDGTRAAGRLPCPWNLPHRNSGPSPRGRAHPQRA
jgi:hypothetical protein